MERRFWFLLYILATDSLITAVTTLTKTSNACYSAGGDCGFHFLSCDRGFTISLRAVHYGFKQAEVYAGKECGSVLTNCAELAHNRTACCQYDAETDCLRAFTAEHRRQIEGDCNGRGSCSFHATHANGGCKNPQSTVPESSTFSLVRYDCVNDTLPQLRTQATATSACATCSTAAFPTTKTVQDHKHDDDRLQLIVGVSVGVGSGIIALVVIAAVCWIRIRRKPPQAPGSLSGRSEFPGGSTLRHASRTPSNAHTMTSSMPSSLYSSFLYSDTLPSSHPDSIYSMPGDGSTADSVSYFRNYGYDSVGEPAPLPDARSATNESGLLPELPERPKFKISPHSLERNASNGEAYRVFALFQPDNGEGSRRSVSTFSSDRGKGEASVVSENDYQPFRDREQNSQSDDASVSEKKYKPIKKREQINQSDYSEIDRSKAEGTRPQSESSNTSNNYDHIENNVHNDQNNHVSAKLSSDIISKNAQTSGVSHRSHASVPTDDEITVDDVSAIYAVSSKARQRRVEADVHHQRPRRSFPNSAPATLNTRAQGHKTKTGDAGQRSHVQRSDLTQSRNRAGQNRLDYEDIDVIL